MNVLYYVMPVLVLAWTAWGAVEYPKLKAKLAGGDRAALLREYKLTLIGEIVGGVLAVVTVGLTIYRPAHTFNISISPAIWSVVAGAFAGVALSALWFTFAADKDEMPKMIGDIAALMPQSAIERKWFAAVAVAAGVCEELVFRGFGMHFFHHIGVTGWWIAVASAVVFGSCHVYQGIAGAITTGVIGFVCALAYVAGGSLLLPIALHVAIDLRALVVVPLGVTSHSKPQT